MQKSISFCKCISFKYLKKPCNTLNIQASLFGILFKIDNFLKCVKREIRQIECQYVLFQKRSVCLFILEHCLTQEDLPQILSPIKNVRSLLKTRGRFLHLSLIHRNSIAADFSLCWRKMFRNTLKDARKWFVPPCRIPKIRNFLTAATLLADEQDMWRQPWK